MGSNNRQSFIIGGLLVAIGTIHLCTLRPGHDWGGDFGMYIHHAMNIAEGVAYADTGYVYNPSYSAIGPPTYPPVCPLLLAPVCLAFGLNFTAIKLVMVASLILFLGFMFLCFRKELPFPHVAAIVALVGLNHFSMGDANSIGSDLPFMALLYAALVLIQKAYSGAEKTPPQWAYLLPAAVLMYLAFGTRTLGGLLLPSLATVHTPDSNEGAGWRARWD